MVGEERIRMVQAPWSQSLLATSPHRRVRQEALTALEGWGTPRGHKNLSTQIGLQGWDHTIQALGGKGCVYLHTVLITIGSYFCLGLPDAMLVNVYNKQ